MDRELEAATRLGESWATLPEVWWSSGEGLEAGAGLERTVDIGGDVWRLAEAERAKEGSTELARGRNESRMLRRSLGEVLEQRWKSRALGVRLL